MKSAHIKKFIKGHIYIVKEECWKNKEKFVTALESKSKDGWLHIKWIASKDRGFINPSCILRKAEEGDKDDLMVELL